jgi:hypothetical protein
VTVWTPSTAVAVKVIGLAWRGEELLVAEVEESDGRVKGVRPLGGSIEFGETREAALKREFVEELRCEISISGPWHTFENIYQHEGRTGHGPLPARQVQLPRARRHALLRGVVRAALPAGGCRTVPYGPRRGDRAGPDRAA